MKNVLAIVGVSGLVLAGVGVTASMALTTDAQPDAVASSQPTVAMSRLPQSAVSEASASCGASEITIPEIYAVEPGSPSVLEAVRNYDATAEVVRLKHGADGLVYADVETPTTTGRVELTQFSDFTWAITSGYMCRPR